MPLRPDVLASLAVPAPDPPEDVPPAGLALYGPLPADCPVVNLRRNLSSGVSTAGLFIMLLLGRDSVATWMMFRVPSSRRLLLLFVLGCLAMAPTWMLLRDDGGALLVPLPRPLPRPPLPEWTEL